MRLLRALGPLFTTSLVAACLFPSFDDLGKEASPTRPSDSSGDDDAQAPSGADGGSSGDTRKDGGGDPGPKPDATAAPADSGVDAGPPQTVLCNNGTRCTVGTQFCCIAPAFVGCQPLTKIGDCTGPIDFAVRCDGSEDCPGGQICCATDGEVEAKCKTSCSGVSDHVMCTSGTPCPASQSCTPVGGIGHKSCR